MEMVGGLFVGGGNYINVVEVDNTTRLPAENCVVIIRNIYDREMSIKLPKPKDAAGLFFSITTMPNPSSDGGGDESDITIIDGEGTTLATIDEWGEGVLLWSDGFYFHELQITAY